MSRPRRRSARPGGMLAAVLAPLLAGATALGVLAALPSYAAAELPPSSGTAAGPSLLVAPAIRGESVVDARVRVSPGRWDAGEHEQADLEMRYQWLRAGRRVRGATERHYRASVDDLGRRLSVRVVATDPEGRTAVVTTEPGDRVRKATLELRRRPAVRGTARYTRTLTVDPGRWSRTPTRVRYQWRRGGEPVAGATRARHVVAPADVGRRLRVQVSLTRPGYRWTQVLTGRQRAVRHRVDQRRSVSYHVETRGRVSADVATFRRQARTTFADPRGWRGAGVGLREVRRGGSFTLVLAEASTLPSFSSGCSTQWSCRVGRYVVINQTRWRQASAAWNAAGRSRRDYRHMVLNHEVGHWLGRGHVGCAAPGALAPVMMQQSKGTGSCRFNPWPTRAEQSR